MKNKTLHEWQQEAFDYFNEHPKCVLGAATGTGKTYIAIQIIKRILTLKPNIKCLIVVPKNVKRTYHGGAVRILQLTAERDAVRETGCEEFSLTEVGIYYGEIKEISRITITNMHNLDNLKENGLFKEFDFIVWDELHNYMTQRLLNYIKIDKTYKLGLTATIKRKDHKHWKQLELFDFNYFEYSIDAAVKDEILSRFRFTTIGITLDKHTKDKYDEIDAKIKQYEAMDKMKANFNNITESKVSMLRKRRDILAKNNAKEQIFERFKDDILGRKSIVFVENNSVAPGLYWGLTGQGFSPCIFNSDIPKEKRKENLNGYTQDKYDIILTTRALDEGYNLPKIDLAIILGGSSNIRQAIQRI